MVVPGTGGQNLLSSLWPSVLGAAHLILFAPEAPLFLPCPQTRLLGTR